MAFGGTIKLQGESEYRKALSSIKDNLTLLNSELKVVTSSFSKNSRSIEDLKNKNEVLNKKMEEQKSKVEICRAALDEAKKSTDSNATTIKYWQNALNNAQAELNKTNSEIRDNETSIKKMEKANVSNTKELKEFEKAEEKAGKQTITFGDLIKANLISEGIIAGVKGLANVMKFVASELINVGKQAITNYADYEQLVGGVETLFKDSSGTVEGYANSAYKTAGLSANEYMETVTSFSASLLSSLKGDTKKAAEVSDMAITDMADNANKMGTSMDMVQSAYQGFAKQNYTMLDNLKLGYGGTKTEMERLLKDAQKISGIKYNINNLNDVYQAIHVIQGELGITGTTAKEASETISGSVAATKSAWQNLLTGIANENADFNDLVNNFVDSLITAAKNILPRIQVAVEGLSLLITDLLGLLLSEIIPMGVQLIQNLIQGISKSFPDILSSINNAIGLITEALLGMLPQLLNMGINIIISLIQGISESAPKLIPVITEAILLMANSLIENLPLLISAGLDLIMSLIEGLVAALPTLVAAIPQIIASITTALLDPEMLAKLLECAVRLIIALGVGLISAIPQLLTMVPQIIISLANSFKKTIKETNWGELGKNMLKGIMEGFGKAKDVIKQTIKKFKDNFIGGIKSFFGIHSPSTLMRDIVGVNLAKGIGVGFSEEMKSVSSQMQDIIPRNFDFDFGIRELSRVKNASNDYQSGALPTSGVANNNDNSFNITINNNSKFTSPAENARLFRREYEMYNLKHGKVGV